MPGITSRIARVLFVCACTLPLRAQDQRPAPTAIWAPKPGRTPAYPPGQTPWTTLSDLKAKHQSDANWRQLIVDNGRLTGEYVGNALLLEPRPPRD